MGNEQENARTSESALNDLLCDLCGEPITASKVVLLKAQTINYHPECFFKKEDFKEITSCSSWDDSDADPVADIINFYNKEAERIPMKDNELKNMLDSGLDHIAAECPKCGWSGKLSDCIEGIDKPLCPECLN